MSGPARDEPPESAGEFFRGLLAAGKDAAAQKTAVTDAVREKAAGKSRDALRVVFEAELDRQGVPRDPIWVESKLDELEDSPTERARKVGKGVALAATTLPKLLRGLGGAGGDVDPPEWMRRPAEASYWGWAPGAVKRVVQIEARSVALLERVLREAPQRVGHEFAVFDVWFDRATDDGPIGVFLGRERVGVLESHPPHGLGVQISAARESGVKAFATATLARARHLMPRFLLVVEVAPADAPPRPRAAHRADDPTIRPGDGAKLPGTRRERR